MGHMQTCSSQWQNRNQTFQTTHQWSSSVAEKYSTNAHYYYTNEYRWTPMIVQQNISMITCKHWKHTQSKITCLQVHRSELIWYTKPQWWMFDTASDHTFSWFWRACSAGINVEVSAFLRYNNRTLSSDVSTRIQCNVDTFVIVGVTTGSFYTNLCG